MEEAPWGGSAEARARSRQYDYATNSNLVVSTVPSDAAYHVPTGEPETLWGRARSFGVYEPRTKETRAAYNALLGLIQQHLGGQRPDAADEVLATLKIDKVTNADKKKEIEKLINPMSNLMFEQLVSVAKLITDFRDAGAGGDGTH